MFLFSLFEKNLSKQNNIKEWIVRFELILMISKKIYFNIDTTIWSRCVKPISVIFDLIFVETKIVWHSFVNIWYLWQHICRQRFCAFSQVMKRKSSWLTIIREQKFSLSKKFERLGFLRHVVLFLFLSLDQTEKCIYSLLACLKTAFFCICLLLFYF